MIGFVTTKEQADAVNDAVRSAQVSRGKPVYWLPGAYPIFQGEHAGSHFIPCDDAILATPLVGTPPKTPMDFPEFSQIIGQLGGLEARVDLPSGSLQSASRPKIKKPSSTSPDPAP